MLGWSTTWEDEVEGKIRRRRREKRMGGKGMMDWMSCWMIWIDWKRRNSVWLVVTRKIWRVWRMLKIWKT